MIEREASCRCCAIESAISFNASILSSWLVKMAVVRGGISSRGLVMMEVSSSAEVIVAREEGSRGGSVWEEEASRIGVDVVEFSVDGGRTRFARKKEKKAAEQGDVSR